MTRSSTKDPVHEAAVDLFLNVYERLPHELKLQVTKQLKAKVREQEEKQNERTT